MTNMTVNQFVEDLKQSFADVTFPTKKMFIDTANDTFDADYASDQLRDKSWQEIDIKLLIRNRDKLTYLTPEGFHFLLPAYLMTMVTSSKNIDIMTENVLLALIPTDEVGKKMLSQRVRRISKAQSASILHFLENFDLFFPPADWSFSEEAQKNIQHGIVYWGKKAR
ncbi:MAG: DUF6714 family protein [Phototrophicaceae bacterium]